MGYSFSVPAMAEIISKLGNGKSFLPPLLLRRLLENLNLGVDRVGVSNFIQQSSEPKYIERFSYILSETSSCNYNSETISFSDSSSF